MLTNVQHSNKFDGRGAEAVVLPATPPLGAKEGEHENRNVRSQKGIRGAKPITTAQTPTCGIVKSTPGLSESVGGVEGTNASIQSLVWW